MSISILPNRLQLLTLPKDKLPFLIHPIIKNLYFRDLTTPSTPTSSHHHRSSEFSIPNSPFFSYTENSFEVSLIADIDTVDDFAKLHPPGLIICPDIFRALQIDNNEELVSTGDDFEPHNAHNNSAKRISQLSGPLAKAGISIFYLSTYQTDFVFVKERRVPLVVRTLRECGFEVDWEEEADEMGGVGDGGLQVDVNNQQYGASPNDNMPLSPPQVFTELDTTEENGVEGEDLHTRHESTLRDNDADVRNVSRKVVPGNHLRLVGLNKDYIDTWIMKLIGIMFFPDCLSPFDHDNHHQHQQQQQQPWNATSPHQHHHHLQQHSHYGSSTSLSSLNSISTTSSSIISPNPSSTPTTPRKRFVSYTSTEEGISLIIDESLLTNLPEHTYHDADKSLRCIQVDLRLFGMDRFGIVHSMSNPLSNANVNLLYLSTFKTANVLVHVEDLSRAMEILNKGDAEAGGGSLVGRRENGDGDTDLDGVNRKLKEWGLNPVVTTQSVIQPNEIEETKQTESIENDIYTQKEADSQDEEVRYDNDANF